MCGGNWISRSTYLGSDAGVTSSDEVMSSGDSAAGGSCYGDKCATGCSVSGKSWFADESG